jgi:hypothetical protein
MLKLDEKKIVEIIKQNFGTDRPIYDNFKLFNFRQTF